MFEHPEQYHPKHQWSLEFVDGMLNEFGVWMGCCIFTVFLFGNDVIDF